jgi:hypothetical protein
VQARGESADEALARGALEVEVDGVTVTETPLELRHPSGTVLSAVLAEPPQATAGLCAVFLNSGAIGRTGPSRMWVEAARRWAATRGVPSLRLDIEGIGESDGTDDAFVDPARFHDPHLIDQARFVLDELQRRGVADRFLLVSMCAGAYWSFHIALDDRRVSGFIALNQGVIVWDTGLEQSRDLRRVLASRAIMRIREPEARARVKATMKWVWRVARERAVATVTRSRTPVSILGANEIALSRLISSDVRATFVFCMGEWLEAELRRTGRLAEFDASPNISVERIAVFNHTLRPLWAQERAHEILDHGLDRELGLPARA